MVFYSVYRYDMALKGFGSGKNINEQQKQHNTHIVPQIRYVIDDEFKLHKTKP